MESSLTHLCLDWVRMLLELCEDGVLADVHSLAFQHVYVCVAYPQRWNGIT